MTREQFYAALVPAAVKAMHELGIPASVTIAQGLLESDWGQSSLFKQANNAFGIKAQEGDGWNGARICNPTWEVINGCEEQTSDWFRKYGSLVESVEDHAKFLRRPRYAAAYAVRHDYKAFANAIWAAGYATDPHYPGKLIQLIQDYQLAKHDLE